MAKRKIPKGLDEDDRKFIEEKMTGRSSSYTATHTHVNYNFKINFKAKNELQKQFWNAMRSDSILTICEGPAGTGKSYVAMAFALKSYLEGRYNKINIVVPTVEASTMALGLMPGDLNAKLSYYIEESIQNLCIVLEHSDNINPRGIVEGLMRNGVIEFHPISFLRGKNLRGLTLITEAENMTTNDIYLIYSRLSDSGKKHKDDDFESGKIVVTGDRMQTDRKEIKKDFHACSGLVYSIEHLAGMPEVDIIEFTSDMVVRNPFITKLIERWNMSLDEITELNKKEAQKQMKEKKVSENNIPDVPRKRRGRPKKSETIES